MAFLVAYASKHGATGGVAGRVAATGEELRLPGAWAMLPEGDFRDRTDIDAWARVIAEEMSTIADPTVPDVRRVNDPVRASAVSISCPRPGSAVHKVGTGV